MQNKSFLDLKAVFAVYQQRWLHGWSELCEMPVLRRLLPSVRVRVLDAQTQSSSIVSVPGFEAVGAGSKKTTAQPADFFAVTLPESAFLQRRIDVPVTSIAESRSAMQLEVEAASPFPPDQTVWGWRAAQSRPGFFAADVVITSRMLVDGAVAALSLPAMPVPEVWVRLNDSYAVIDGFGEDRRLRVQKRRMRHFLSLFVIIALLLCALAVTPLAQKRAKVIDAQHRQAELMMASGEVNVLREQLNTLFALHENLGPRFNREKNVAALLDQLSAILPDGSWLNYFEYHPGSLRLGGYADDAIALQRKLQEQPGFSNVRATAPISRDSRLNKDRFTFDLDMKL